MPVQARSSCPTRTEPPTARMTAAKKCRGIGMGEPRLRANNQAQRTGTVESAMTARKASRRCGIRTAARLGVGKPAYAAPGLLDSDLLRRADRLSAMSDRQPAGLL